MDNSQLGLMMCCGLVIIPMVLGVVIGRRLERRIQQYGWPGGMLPGFARKILEDAKWK